MIVRLAAIVVIAFVMLGAVLPSRGLTIVLGGSGAFPMLPVTIVDGTATVVAVTVGDLNGLARAPIAAVAGRPDAIEYRWIGGRCDRAVSLTVDRIDGTLSLRRIDTVAGDACLLDGISRSIVIVFREPIDASTVVDLTDYLY